MWTPWTSYKNIQTSEKKKRIPWILWNPWTYRDFGIKNKIYRYFSRFHGFYGIHGLIETLV
jgi:hypothetical protein